MKQLEQLQPLMASFKNSQATLQAQMAEFQKLQHEIQELQARAHRDPDAQAKLNRLSQMMTGDYQQLRSQLLSKVSEAEAQFQLLEQQLKGISASSGSTEEAQTKSASATPSGKKSRRTFV